MVKKIIILMLICFWVFQSVDAQTYLQGYNVISLSEAASCDLLLQSKRLTTNQAFEKLNLIVSDPIKKNVKAIVGESWWLEGDVELIPVSETEFKIKVANLNTSGSTMVVKVRARETNSCGVSSYTIKNITLSGNI